MEKILKFLGIYKTYIMKITGDSTQDNEGFSYPAKLVKTNYYFFYIKYKTTPTTFKVVFSEKWFKPNDIIE